MRHTISSKHKVDPTVYNVFFQECQTEQALSFDRTGISLEQQLETQSRLIYDVIHKTFQGVREIHMFARWMREDERLQEEVGLGKTKTFLKEKLQKDGNEKIYHILSLLPKEDLDHIALATRDIITNLSKKTINRNNQRALVNQATKLSPDQGLTLGFFFKQNPKTKVGPYDHLTYAQSHIQSAQNSDESKTDESGQQSAPRP